MPTLRPVQIGIPAHVRIRPGALGALGPDLASLEFRHVALLSSEGFVESMADDVVRALETERIHVGLRRVVREASLEQAQGLFSELPTWVDAIIGLGGGKALDVAKYVAFIARRPYVAVPTSLSNDGFCSPQSSLTLAKKRRSMPATLPYAVVIDTTVCGAAPDPLFCSGVGDLVSKLTAVHDWHLAAARANTPVDDLAALLSDATVYQYIANPTRDEGGMQLFATALMLNGIAMEIAGSSRPASGSEHLISHALDAVSERPRLHGLQVGTAAYLVSAVQSGQNRAWIAGLLETTGFFRTVATDPFHRSEWEAAIRLAPTIKDQYYTVLSERDWTLELIDQTRKDPVLSRCFVE